MGKISKFKAIRKVASTMPVIQVDVVKGEKHLEKTLDGSFILHTRKVIEQQPFNHYRKMKHAYYRGGINEVNAYTKALANYVADQKLQAANS